MYYYEELFICSSVLRGFTSLIVYYVGKQNQNNTPDNKVHGANIGQEEPGGPHVGPMNLAI